MLLNVSRNAVNTRNISAAYDTRVRVSNTVAASCLIHPRGDGHVNKPTRRLARSRWRGITQAHCAPRAFWNEESQTLNPTSTNSGTMTLQKNGFVHAWHSLKDCLSLCCSLKDLPFLTGNIAGTLSAAGAVQLKWHRENKKNMKHTTRFIFLRQIYKCILEHIFRSREHSILRTWSDSWTALLPLLPAMLVPLAPSFNEQNAFRNK